MTLDIWSENSSRCTLKTSWLYFVLSNTPLKLRNVSRKVAGSGVVSVLPTVFVFSGAELQFILLCLAKSFSYAICIYLIGTRAQYKFRTVNYEQSNCISHKGSSFFFIFSLTFFPSWTTLRFHRGMSKVILVHECIYYEQWKGLKRIVYIVFCIGQL